MEDGMEHTLGKFVDDTKRGRVADMLDGRARDSERPRQIEPKKSHEIQ